LRLRPRRSRARRSGPAGRARHASAAPTVEGERFAADGPAAHAEPRRRSGGAGRPAEPSKPAEPADRCIRPRGTAPFSSVTLIVPSPLGQRGVLVGIWRAAPDLQRVRALRRPRHPGCRCPTRWTCTRCRGGPDWRMARGRPQLALLPDVAAGAHRLLTSLPAAVGRMETAAVRPRRCRARSRCRSTTCTSEGASAAASTTRCRRGVQLIVVSACSRADRTLPLKPVQLFLAHRAVRGYELRATALRPWAFRASSRCTSSCVTDPPAAAIINLVPRVPTN